MAGRSMSTAISGIRNQQVFMDVIANNISNSGTMGFKRGRITFEESFYQLLQGASRPPGDQGGVNPLQVGNGTSVGSIDTVMVQGPIQSTGNQTDLAIRGDGFFVVSDGQRDYYTRAGSFQWDSNGRLVIPFNGMKVQGRIADDTGLVDDGSPIADIEVPFGTIDAAQTTSNVNFVGNLDADADPIGNIMTAKRLYSQEIAGAAKDMNGLYANGNANFQITGLTSLSTTVTVLIDDATTGENSNTYTYVSADSGSSSKDFHTLDDLIAEINNDFSTLASVALDDDGALAITNLGAATNTITLSSVNSVLDKALASANGVVGAKVTDQFSHVAVGTDQITTLRDSSGVDLGVALTDTINIDGRIGGTPITSASFAVDAGDGTSNTYADFVSAVKTAYQITNVDAVKIDAANGAMEINADGGTAFAITGVKISTNAEALGGTGQVFDGVFDATVGNWAETQEAKDVTHSAAVRVFDSLGNSHSLSLEFKKDVTLPNRWEWTVAVPEPAELSGGYTGTVTFSSSGMLEAFTYSQGASSFTFDPKNGADVPVDIVLDFGDLGSASGITQFSSTSTVIARDQNGYSSGVLDNVVIGEDGMITGLFTNGNSRTIGRLVLATFNNSSGLLRVGDNTFDVSGNSGLPIFGFAGSSINATITPGAIEMSNVDIAEEFTSMIMAQRSFQANARTVVTADEIMQETVNMKR